MKNQWIFALAVASVLGACKKDAAPENTTQEGEEMVLNLPETPYAYNDFELPGYITSILDSHDDTYEYGPVTDWGATLGRVIFYDRLVSKKGNVACASCHIQEFGFSDTARFSVGDDGGLTGRHSMALANARFRVGDGFFWDERAASLEEQVLMPIQDEVEMNMTLDTLVERMSNASYYPELFEKAFGTDEVTTDRIASALAQFVRSMNSFNSRFDEGLAMHPVNQPFSNFTPQENLGKDVFMRLDKGKCASCHSTEAMITDFARNNGISGRSTDPGLADVTGNPLDFGKFRAPSLRNIAIRPPYMHNGGFATLDEVVLAYNSGIAWSPSLDPHFLTPGGQGAIRLNLSNEELGALVKFMETLTDESFLTDPKFSTPFVE